MVATGGKGMMTRQRASEGCSSDLCRVRLLVMCSRDGLLDVDGLRTTVDYLIRAMVQPACVAFLHAVFP